MPRYTIEEIEPIWQRWLYEVEAESEEEAVEKAQNLELRDKEVQVVSQGKYAGNIESMDSDWEVLNESR